jgi:hypothetical protein
VGQLALERALDEYLKEKKVAAKTVTATEADVNDFLDILLRQQLVEDDKLQCKEFGSGEGMHRDNSGCFEVAGTDSLFLQTLCPRGIASGTMYLHPHQVFRTVAGFQGFASDIVEVVNLQ